MKKIIAILLAVLAISAVTVTAFAAGSPEAAETESAAPAKEETTIAAALTEEQALAAALKDAGLKEADVTVDRNKLTEKTTADGETVAVYSVKFSNDTTTCKYYIDANTGAILYKSLVFQSADVVFAGHSHDGASGEMNADANGEMNADASGEMGRSGRHHDASEDAEADVLTDTTAA